MCRANSCPSSHETNRKQRLQNSFRRHYCSIQRCLRNITSLCIYHLIFFSKSPLCWREMVSVLLRVLCLQSYASDCGSLWDLHCGLQPWSRWPQDHHCLSFVVPLSLRVFSVSSLLRLGPSHICQNFYCSSYPVQPSLSLVFFVSPAELPGSGALTSLPPILPFPSHKA